MTETCWTTSQDNNNNIIGSPERANKGRGADGDDPELVAAGGELGAGEAHQALLQLAAPRQGLHSRLAL